MINFDRDITIAEIAEALDGSGLMLRPDMMGGAVVVRKEYDDSKLPTVDEYALTNQAE